MPNSFSSSRAPWGVGPFNPPFKAGDAGTYAPTPPALIADDRFPFLPSPFPKRPPVGLLTTSGLIHRTLCLPIRSGMDALSNADYESAAGKLGCGAKIVHAMAIKEDHGAGFDNYNRPVILYEPLHFRALIAPNPHGKPGELTQKYMRLYSELTSFQHKPPHLYGTWDEQWQHLQAAYVLSPEMALASTSWGMFQQLGGEYKALGFSSVQALVSAMCRSEQDHLTIFVQKIQNADLGTAMQKLDFRAIAYGYNGPKYANKKQHAVPYDVELKRIYDSL